ncbi:lipopolysaccharide biosynthesis protein [Lichenihabitans psoromatis]|uniref:lipopolysaccharide biosynthesis protein n=1 Tax=Lichenihabitans psoromatis TaxID=2528642 RepID=UPI001036E0DE|nr:polysaccharide biosynthesis C-terminal domain-containing protein [Lichenihabitans psoromatis]
MIIVLTFMLNAGLNFLLGLAVAAVLGPEQYGRFAVAAMVAIVIGTAAFDWLRLSATRFYTEAARAADPELRASLEVAYAGLGFALLVAAALVIALQVDIGLSAAMLAATVAAAICNTRFDYTAALARARFLDRTYSVLVVTKNVASFGLMIGAAFWFKNAAAVMAALALSGALAILPARSILLDHGVGLRGATRSRVVAFAHYGFPIVTANVIYQVIVLVNRGAAAAHLGFADAGQLSLATDMSIRLLLAVGAALDVYLFQLVVRRDATDGRAAAHEQIVRNMLIVTAVLVLLAVGYVMAMPAFEVLVVPPRFRADFGPVSLVLTPGILAFCLVNFALNPVFQIEGQTRLVVVAAAAALAVDLGGLALLSPHSGVLSYAIVHAVSLLVGFVLAAIFALRHPSCRPPLRDLAAIGLAAALAAVVIWPTRSIGEPVVALAAAMIGGTSIYLLTLYLADVAGFRDLSHLMIRWVFRARSKPQVGPTA